MRIGSRFWKIALSLLLLGGGVRAQPEPQIEVQCFLLRPLGSDSMQVGLSILVPFPETPLPGVLEAGRLLHYRLDVSLWNDRKELVYLKHFVRRVTFVPGGRDTLQVQWVLPRGRYHLSCYPLKLPVYIAPVRYLPLNLTAESDDLQEVSFLEMGNFSVLRQ